MHRSRVSGRVVQLIAGHLSFGAIASRGALSSLDSVYKLAAKHCMSCGIPWVFLKYERRAYYSAEDKFERFRGFLELIGRFEFEFRCCGT